MKQILYLDHAATTPLRQEAFDAMLPFLTYDWSNPSSSYEFASRSRQAIVHARQQVAGLFHASPEQIFFTSGGTESDNWAIKAYALSHLKKGKHLITTAIEHHAVLYSMQQLESLGFSITYLNPDKTGRISPAQLEQALRPDTILVSIMYANNEIGTIEPIEELSSICQKHHIAFHTDAVQAAGHLELRLDQHPVDFLSASAHKLYGPKGIGCLYIRDASLLPPMLTGGGQELGLRAGTENVAAIAGFGAAAECAAAELKKAAVTEGQLRDNLIQFVLSQIPFSRLNGNRQYRLPGNANFSFQFINGSTLSIMLGLKGICTSNGSACNSLSTKPSHVLKAIGLSDTLALGSLRVTIGRMTTPAQIRHFEQVLMQICRTLRETSDDYPASFL